MAQTAMERKGSAEVTRAERTRSARQYRPNVDIIERADELLVLADLPGVKAGDIDINFQNGTLTLHGRVNERQSANTGYLLCEYGLGDFHREFQVSEQVDAARISAEYANGVLTLHLPKVEAAKPRKIKVQVK